MSIGFKIHFAILAVQKVFYSNGPRSTRTLSHFEEIFLRRWVHLSAVWLQTSGLVGPNKQRVRHEAAYLFMILKSHIQNSFSTASRLLFPSAIISTVELFSIVRRPIILRLVLITTSFESTALFSRRCLRRKRIKFVVVCMSLMHRALGWTISRSWHRKKLTESRKMQK